MSDRWPWRCEKCGRANTSYSTKCGRCGADYQSPPPAPLTSKAKDQPCPHANTYIPAPGIIECLDCHQLWRSSIEPLTSNQRCPYRNTRDEQCAHPEGHVGLHATEHQIGAYWELPDETDVPLTPDGHCAKCGGTVGLTHRCVTDDSSEVQP
jgi:hypothetical protein